MHFRTTDSPRHAKSRYLVLPVILLRKPEYSVAQAKHVLVRCVSRIVKLLYPKKRTLTLRGFQERSLQSRHRDIEMRSCPRAAIPARNQRRNSKYLQYLEQLAEDILLTQ